MSGRRYQSDSVGSVDPKLSVLVWTSGWRSSSESCEGPYDRHWDLTSEVKEGPKRPYSAVFVMPIYGTFCLFFSEKNCQLKKMLLSFYVKTHSYQYVLLYRHFSSKHCWILWIAKFFRSQIMTLTACKLMLVHMELEMRTNTSYRPAFY